MKQNTLHYLLLTALFLFQCMSFQLWGSTSAILNVTAGNLGMQLGSFKDSITNLVLTGEINGNDINHLRTMANLTDLNLGDVTIVAGGSYTFNGKAISTTKNQIPSFMFYDNIKLTNVTLPKGITAIGEHAFYICSGLNSITIPNGVTTLGDFAFHDCLRITSITIGDSLDSIGFACFCGGYRLKEFIVSENNAAFCSVNGVLYSKNKDKLIHFPNQCATKYTILDGVTTIEHHAFCGCPTITSITIPSSVEKIGSDAFYDCSGLKIINCNASAPPTLYAETFFNVNKESCVLNVPVGSSSAYRAAFVWGDFVTMLENGLSAKPEIKTNRTLVYTEENRIVIKCSSSIESVSVFSSFGVLLKTIKTDENEIRLEVPANRVYIVKMAGRTYKVVL